jgi:hypothetical protein
VWGAPISGTLPHEGPVAAVSVGSTPAAAKRSVTDPARKSLFKLIADVPALVKELVRGEIAQAKAELIIKAKALGIGGALMAVALVLVLYALGVFLTAAVFGLAYVMPDWLAAIVVALVLIIIAGVLGFIGYKKFKKGLPPVPEGTVASVKRDIDTVKGMAK